MTEPLTDRQEKILAFIKKSIHDQGYPPTIREIGEHFGIRSTNGVNDHLKALERKGYLLRGELKSRALSVIDGGRAGPPRVARMISRRELSAVSGGEAVEGPVGGKGAAGEPILAAGNIPDHRGHDHRLVVRRKALKGGGGSLGPFTVGPPITRAPVPSARSWWRTTGFVRRNGSSSQACKKRAASSLAAA